MDAVGLQNGVTPLPGGVKRSGRERFVGATHVLLLLALGITVLAVLTYDLRLYHGVRFDGGPIYPERDDVVPLHDFGTNAVPDDSAISSSRASTPCVGDGPDFHVVPVSLRNTVFESPRSLPQRLQRQGSGYSAAWTDSHYSPSRSARASYG
jgi:hypothetical protein